MTEAAYSPTREEDERRQRARHYVHQARADFVRFCAKFMKVRPKTAVDGGLVPLIMNLGQARLHANVQKQLDIRGFVRSICLKPRQIGWSTYIAARGYYRCSGTRGYNVMILTHLDTATANLFGIARRYHRHMDERLKPHAQQDSAHGLYFDRLDSRYVVGTAGNREFGHSETVQLFHGSEAARWPDARKIAVGALQTIPPQGLGTEAYLESTANGTTHEGEYFYKQWKFAVKGASDFVPFFMPWFDHPEYAIQPPIGLELSADDEQYMEVYGLTIEQMAFRASKIIDLGGGELAAALFAQQYPANPDEAFQTSDTGALIPSVYVMRARRTRVEAPVGPCIWGIDPSHLGMDRFIIYGRRGRKLKLLGKWKHADTVESSHRIVSMIRNCPADDRPDALMIDAVGVGAGVADQLIHADIDDIPVFRVLGGDSPDDPEQYYNKRAECYGRFKEFMLDKVPPEIPDDDELQADITSIKPLPDTRYRLKIISKEQIRAEDLPSPDHADAASLTFAYQVGTRSTGSNRLDPKRPVNWRA